MLTIEDFQKYQRHGRARTTFREGALSMLLFGSVGAITWAIRGTGGWGGMDGTLVPGLSWGLLWWYLCHRKGIDARGVPLWVGLGIALGGELGYGQYVSWIQGNFNAGDEVITISPWIGYAWFFVCGIGWAAPGGIVLGWALSRSASPTTWLVRLVFPVGFALAMRLAIQACPWLFFPRWNLDIYSVQFEGAWNRVASSGLPYRMIQVWCAVVLLTVSAWGASALVRRPHWGLRCVTVAAAGCTIALLLPLCEWLFFPSDYLGIFRDDLGTHLRRTVYTNSQNAIVLGWWVGAMFVAGLQRDWPTVAAGGVIGGGFGIGFPLAALWCLGYTYAPGYIDWWKMWELNSGFYLGLLYVIVLYWAVRRVGHDDDPRRAPRHPADVVDRASRFTQWCETTSQSLAVFLVLYVMSRDVFRVVGICLGLFYVIVLLLATRRTRAAREPQEVVSRRRKVSLTYSAFLLLFILFWGASSQAGILLGLYTATDVDQYAWPTERILLFLPAGIVIVGATLVRLGRILRGTDSRLPAGLLLVDLMTVIGVVGAGSIWPAKIGVLYAVFLALAIFAFNRLNESLKMG